MKRRRRRRRRRRSDPKSEESNDFSLWLCPRRIWKASYWLWCQVGSLGQVSSLRSKVSEGQQQLLVSGLVREFLIFFYKN